MAGISNPAFRVICKEFGAGLIYTEMVSDKALYYDNEKTVGMTDVEEQEHPLAMQIFGHDIETMVYAAKFLDEKTDCDIIDINMGCPYPMQARLHRGAGILPFVEEAEALLQTIREFPEMNFSVKLRLGWNAPDEVFALLPVMNSLRLAHVTLHPRIGTQQYKGNVDTDSFARFYEACRHPLFYNGDLNSLEDIDRILCRFPRLAGVMSGRGLLSSPWLAAEYAAGNGFTDEEKKAKLLHFHTLLFEKYSSALEGGDHQILAKMKTLWDYLLPEAEKRLRKKILKSNQLPTYLQAVKELLQ